MGTQFPLLFCLALHFRGMHCYLSEESFGSMRAKTHTLREPQSASVSVSVSAFPTAPASCVRVCVLWPVGFAFQPITMAPWCEFLYALAIVGVCVPLWALYTATYRVSRRAYMSVCVCTTAVCVWKAHFSLWKGHGNTLSILCRCSFLSFLRTKGYYCNYLLIW